MTNLRLLKFSTENAKLGDKIATVSLPAGHSCPFAKDCYSKAHKHTGKIIDGKHCQFRCYSASQEALYPALRKARWHNFELLKETPKIKDCVKLITNSLPVGKSIIRPHVGGDYYNESYFLSWLNVAANNPKTLFYSYTKSLRFWVKYKSEVDSVPNFKLVASKGGKDDHLIEEHGLRFAEVVYSVEEAKEKKLEIDHDDSHAYASNKSFSLLLHNTQPTGTKAAEALKKLRKIGIGGYGQKNKPAKSPLAIPKK